MNKTRSYLHYNVFKVGSATDEHPLTISGFTGITPTDPFLNGHPLDGKKFSTYDNDNDALSNINFVAKIGNNRGWWYNNCWFINPNAKFYHREGGFMYFAGTWYNPRWIEMKIRPLNCTPQ